MDQQTLLIGIGIVAAIVLLSARRNKNGRWDDSDVNLERVLASLEGFSAHSESKLKRGFTEKSIEKQLAKHLKREFETVNSQKGLSGINGHKIDLDLGSGTFGIELKIARELFKTRAVQTLSGQVDDYRKHYDEDSFLVVVFCTPEEMLDRVWKNEIETRLKPKSTEVIWKGVIDKVDL